MKSTNHKAFAIALIGAMVLPAAAFAQSRYMDSYGGGAYRQAPVSRDIDPTYSSPAAREFEHGSALVLHEDNGGVQHDRLY